MDIVVQQTICEEFLNRYDKLIFSRILKFKQKEDAKDLFQDFCLHIYQKIPVEFHKNPDAFSSSSWVVQVVDNFLKSDFRKENAQKNIQRRTVSQLSDYQWEAISSSFKEGAPQVELTTEQFDEVLRVIFQHISKRDELMLKMKYYYDKPSKVISEKLNISHVNMQIKRVKEQIQLRIPRAVYHAIREKFFGELDLL
jgi:RNA polymerase sigma factor (sigma-70 family)